MRIVLSGNPETQTIIVIASEAGIVKYAEEHNADETLREVLDTVRKFVGESAILWRSHSSEGK